jgi:hypothetical protein
MPQIFEITNHLKIYISVSSIGGGLLYKCVDFATCASTKG